MIGSTAEKFVGIVESPDLMDGRHDQTLNNDSRRPCPCLYFYRGGAVTNKIRQQIAREFKKRLDAGQHRKTAIIMIQEKYSIDRASIYRYCKKFSIQTS